MGCVYHRSGCDDGGASRLGRVVRSEVELAAVACRTVEFQTGQSVVNVMERISVA